MIKKIIGVVLILTGGFFSFAAAKAVLTNPSTMNQLEEAPFITDGKVDPANEGKDVILLVSTDLIENAEDYELGLRFEYPVIHREVEELKYDGVDQIKWERLYSFNDETDSRYFKNCDGKKASDLLWNDYTEQVGAIKISYRGTVVDNIDSIALVGKQVGNRLEKSDDIDSISCFENIHSKEELMKSYKKTSASGIGFGLIVSLALLLSGVFLVVKS